MSLTIGELINKLLDIPSDKHHLPVMIRTDQNYTLPATHATPYDEESPCDSTNPFIIEHYEED